MEPSAIEPWFRCQGRRPGDAMQCRRQQILQTVLLYQRDHQPLSQLISPPDALRQKRGHHCNTERGVQTHLGIYAGNDREGDRRGDEDTTLACENPLHGARNPGEGGVWQDEYPPGRTLGWSFLYLKPIAKRAQILALDGTPCKTPYNPS